MPRNISFRNEDDLRSAQAATELNRVVWMLWLQGFDKAPDVVRLCLRSWKTKNPTWTVVELNRDNLSGYVDSDSLSTLLGLDLPPAKVANLLRLYLMSRHGGVWADATCFCCRPLDDWLPDYMESGFFAFRSKSDAWLRDHMNLSVRALAMRSGARILASWFLASFKGNLLASTVYERHKNYFVKYRFPLQRTKKGRTRLARLERILNRNPRLAQWWTSPLIAGTAKVFPYFIIHYTFAKVVTENRACRDIWNRTPTLLAFGPLRLIRSLVLPITDQQRDDLKNAKEPLYKLTWKYRYEDFREGCVLDYLMQSVPASADTMDVHAQG